GLRGSTWAARTAFAHQDEALAGALVRVGSALPGRIGREEPETQAVRTREAVLVLDAQARPHVHRELVSLGDTRDYAVAPIIVHGRVIGLVHVDRHSQSDIVDSADLELLTLFADGAGLAFERAMYHERFTALRRQFELQISGIDEVVHGTSGCWEPDVEQDLVPHPYLSGGPLSELTRRELEVLQHVAGGASNQDIAGRLGVSAGTVKTHVKGLLHKLGAANRADAGAKYHAYAKRVAPY
ncbi:MAG: LuxR C-terminal-related transcriptional regulator, partial [Pseudonocardia sp.]|nr:LuxR C-terminal-related transcriptional regulator [Pseudonocardia sp.]